MKQMQGSLQRGFWSYPQVDVWRVSIRAFGATRRSGQRTGRPGQGIDDASETNSRIGVADGHVRWLSRPRIGRVETTGCVSIDGLRPLLDGLQKAAER